MGDPQQSEDSLLESVKRMLGNASHLIESRVELILLELKEERLRLAAALLLLVAGAICALLALVLATFTIVVIFWDGHRIAVLLALTVAYAVVAFGAIISLRRRLRRWRAFSASLEQFKKDRECLETKN